MSDLASGPDEYQEYFPTGGLWKDAGNGGDRRGCARSSRAIRRTRAYNALTTCLAKGGAAFEGDPG
jgi:hypothetical protein